MRKIRLAATIMVIALTLSGCGQRANTDNRTPDTARENRNTPSAAANANENKNRNTSGELDTLAGEVKVLQQDLQNHSTGAQDLNIDTTLPTE